MFPSKDVWINLYPEIQHSLVDIHNPYITNIEGFFVLEMDGKGMQRRQMPASKRYK